MCSEFGSRHHKEKNFKHPVGRASVNRSVHTPPLCPVSPLSPCIAFFSSRIPSFPALFPFVPPHIPFFLPRISSLCPVFPPFRPVFLLFRPILPFFRPVFPSSPPCAPPFLPYTPLFPMIPFRWLECSLQREGLGSSLLLSVFELSESILRTLPLYRLLFDLFLKKTNKKTDKRERSPGTTEASFFL